MTSGSPPFIPGPASSTRHRHIPRPSRKAELRIWWREIDRVLLALVLIVMAMGTLAVAVASPASADRLSNASERLPELYFLWLHLRWQVLGLIVLVGVSTLPKEVARRSAILLAMAMVIALLLVPFIGQEVNGARRWLRFGIAFQPSEFLKPAFAVALAWILSWRLRDPNLPVLAISAAAMTLVAGLLMLQPDFGSTVLFFGVWFVLVVLADLPVQRLAWLAGGGLAALASAYLFYENARHRIDAFLGGGTAFDQVDLASRTLLGGGWTGTGMFLGTRKMSLPEAHTDYIFSVIGEEFGLLSCGLIVMLYLAIIARVLVRLVEEDDLFTILAATGLTAQIGGQAFINILVNLQLFPSKGMTLPLISYGGSSTVAICMTVGYLLAITRRNPYLARESFDWRGVLPRRGERS